MTTPLNILIVEDSQDDADLIVAELRRAGFVPRWKRVETEPDFLAEINNSPDIILSDYSMPRFSGLRAAQLARESDRDIPFILISGTVGEDAAVEAMKQGATDYLLKDRIARLGLAVRRALTEAAERSKHKKAAQQIAIQTRALEAAANAILITDQRGTILFANPAFQVLSGYAPDEVLGRTPRLFKSGTHDADFYRRLWETVAGGQVWHGEITNRHKDGTLYYEEMTVTPVRTTGREITHFIAVKQDITGRKQHEDELRWRTAFFEAQVDSSIDGILVVDHQGKKIIQNQRLNDLWKIPRHIVEDKDDAAQVRFVTSRTKNPGQFADKVTHLYSHPDEISRDEIELVDGTILDRYSSPVRDQTGTYYGRIWTFRDITGQRKLEGQYRQAQKMEAVGQLAGGVAHDFNNILAVIQMQADLLKAEGVLSPVQLELAGEIAAAAQRAAALTRQLLLFSRKQTLQLRDLDLNESINDMTKMLRRTIGESVELSFKFAMQPLLIHADAGMMDQVLMNLVVNARDAMPNGGRLVIETSAADFDESVLAQSANARPGAFVCLKVSDTGQGITPENLPRIFEPFFTTKDVGKGTGLGLATIFGIIQQHQGWIHAYSEVEHGTTFCIYLPRLARLSAPKTHPPALPSARGGTETILLVEDDSFLRASVSKALAKLGYRVLEAVSGVEAIEIWKQNRDEIHLMLTDLIMPGGINGKDLGERLLKENPRLKIIYASGYSAEIAGKDFPLTEGVNFLSKPFQAYKLADIVREALDATL